MVVTPLRAARIRLGLSQEALATRAGVGLNTVARAERCPARVSEEVARRLSLALDLPIAAFVAAGSIAVASRPQGALGPPRLTRRKP